MTSMADRLKGKRSTPATTAHRLTEISGHISELANKRISQTPMRYRLQYARSLAGLLSPRQAIAAKCAECNCFEEVSKRTSECGIKTCPLWAYRPTKETQDE